MKLILFRCESCDGVFALPDENKKAFPYCPYCADDDTMDTAEMVDGEIIPDDTEDD